MLRNKQEVRLAMQKLNAWKRALGMEAPPPEINYVDYINSDEWQEKREWLFDHRGRKCESCGNEGSELHVHHLTYERLGNEKSADLKILCSYCHGYIHGKKQEIEPEHISNALKEVLDDIVKAASQ